MSMTTDITITPSTSLVLLKSLSSVTNVYLPAFASSVPLFSVTIRDTTGLSSILTTPVRISTIGSARFVDGTNYYPLDRPYGLVNVSLRNSNTWQVNHTSGKPPAAAAATVGVLSTASSFFTVMSSLQTFVSTFVVENLTTPNSVTITSPFIVANLSTPGFVLMEQSFYVRDNVQLNNRLNVSGPVHIFSSVFTEDLSVINGFDNRVLSSVGIGGNIFVSSLSVKSTVTLTSTVQVSSLQVMLSSIQETSFFSQTLTTAGLISTLGQVAVGYATTVGRNATFAKEVSTFGGQVQTSNLSVLDDTTIVRGISSVAALGATTTFLSSVQGFSPLIAKQSLLFQSTLGLAGTLYTSSLSSLVFSTLGSVSTARLSLLSTASITGNISTSLFQSYQYVSIGGTLFLPGSLSSLSNTVVKGDINVLGSTTFASVHTSSSVGVGGDASVTQSTFASFLTVEGDFQTKNLTTLGFSQIQGSVGVGDSATVYGSLRVEGEPTISSFLVESFLLSNLQIRTSSPFVSFQVSSLHASTIQTDFTRIQAAVPDIYTVSSTYASTTQLTYAEAENARLNTAYTDSLFVGNTSALSLDSSPRFALNVKSQFAQGISSLEVRADLVTASARFQGNAVGTVFYLSNVPAPFPFFSGITTAVSSVTLSTLFASSFRASTFVTTKLANVFSTVITPYLVFESQGFTPRYDVNQFLTLNPTSMVVNRSLTFDRQNNRIGLFQSTPLYDLDISGQVYATNFFYSSINTVVVSTTGTVVYSTIYTSSATVLNSLSYGETGLGLFSQNAFTGDTSFRINAAVSSFADSFGLFDCVEQSTILLNTALQIGRNQRMAVNGVNGTTGELQLPTHALTIKDTLRSEEVNVSTLSLLQSLQTTSIVSPTFTVNCNTSLPLNTLSASVNKLILNSFVTMQTNLLESNRFVGIRTVEPTASLDVRGNAYFSTLYTFENSRTNYVSMGFQEF
jgi:hypothetical protein